MVNNIFDRGRFVDQKEKGNLSRRQRENTPNIKIKLPAKKTIFFNINFLHITRVIFEILECQKVTQRKAKKL